MLKIKDQFATMNQNVNSTYFVELQNKSLVSTGYNPDQDKMVDYLNEKFDEKLKDKHAENKIAVLQLGQSAPG